jgi:hypothetical protein
MTDEQTTTNGNKSEVPAPDAAGATAEVLDIAKRLRAVVAELETGVLTEPGDLLTPSEKLRAIADLIDRRAAYAAPSNGA